MLEDSEKVWRRIEEEIKNNGGKIKAPTKKTWTNPLQEKYQELLEIRSAEYPKAEHYSIIINILNQTKMSDYNNAIENKDRDALYQYWFDKLSIQSCNTGRPSIITDEEYEKYVQIFVDYDMAFKRFPADHPKFPNMPMARTIRDYFDYSAKVHGYETYSEFVRWKYDEGPWKPSGVLLYVDYKYEDKDE